MVSVPKDLEELYELYKLEQEDRLNLMKEDTSNDLKVIPGIRQNRSFINDEGDHLSTLTEEDHRQTPRLGG